MVRLLQTFRPWRPDVLARGLAVVVACLALASPLGAAGPVQAGGGPATAAAPRTAATPRLRVNEAGQLVPVVRAAAAIVYKPITGEVLWQDNSLEQRSIASLTKTMTALVFLEDDPDLDVEVTVTREDVRRASTTYLQSGEGVLLRDLLSIMLVGSDNVAARVLARISPGGAERFVERMNAKARDIGLVSTRFVEPSGLQADNVSSAYDISRLIVRAIADERLAAIMRKPDYTFGTNRRQSVKVRSTNRLIGGDFEVRGGKTGFIQKAGYCLATLVRLPGGDPVAVVVLGARTSATRFLEARRLITWVEGLTGGAVATNDQD
jgi:D-alanyl-D-alanine endopeptidase (penicillin-binding protein 7)